MSNKYQITCTKEQLSLIARAVEDWSRFLGGQCQMTNATSMLDNYHDMDDKYPDACEDSAVFLVASDGQKVSGMFNGADDLVCQTLTHYIVKDSGVRSIITSALVTAMQYLNDKKDDNIKETVE